MISDFGSIQHVTLTVLVDNYASLIAESNDTVEYFLSEPLLAEHGFSMLVQVDDAAETILWDCGSTPEVLLENMRRLGVDPQSIQHIALSHGHFDHVGGLSDLLRRSAVKPKALQWQAQVQAADLDRYARGPRIPIAAHPEIARERWSISEKGVKTGPFLPPPQEEWQSLGGDMLLDEGPQRILPGVWTTGYIPRAEPASPAPAKPQDTFYRVGDDFRPDDYADDQSLILNLEGKGLVIVSGCAHAGILNTIAYARQVSGIQPVYAVLGGFHLAASEDAEIDRTVAALREISPTFISPCHCTGMKAAYRISERMPGRYLAGMVGAKFRF